VVGATAPSMTKAKTVSFQRSAAKTLLGQASSGTRAAWSRWSWHPARIQASALRTMSDGNVRPPLRFRQLAEDGGQDAAVAVVVEFDRRVDSDAHAKFFRRAVRTRCANGPIPRPVVGCRRDRRSQKLLRRLVRAIPRNAGRKLQRQNAHPTRLLRWMRSKLVAQHRLNAEELRSFWRPNRGCFRCRIPRGQNDQRRFILFIPHGGVVDGMISLPGSSRVTPPSVRCQKVSDADVGERAARHYAVVARREP